MESCRRPAANVCSLRLHIFSTALLLVTLGGFGAGSPAEAQNQVGIYWDTGYVETEYLVNPVPGAVTGYLVVHDPTTVTGILGWELCVDVAGNGEFLAWTIEGGNINVADPPCFTVGLFEPRPPIDGAVLLANFEYLVTDNRPAIFSLVPRPDSARPDQMSFVSADDPEQLIPLVTPAGVPEVAAVNRANPWPEIDIQELDFGVQPTGSTTSRGFVVTNTGGGDFVLSLFLVGDCDVFALPEISEPIVITPGTAQEVVVTFTPQAAIDYACKLELAGPYPSVQLLGSGRTPTYGYAVTPQIDFGVVVLGDSREVYAVFHNTGETPIPIVPELLNCGPDYDIVLSGEPFTVAPGTSRPVRVRFQPSAIGASSCALGYGGQLDQTLLQGFGREADIVFNILGDLDFGTVFLGAHRDRVISIYNQGEDPIAITAALIGCSEEFSILSGDGPWNLAPGDVRRVTVRFTPVSEGESACALNLGNVLPEIPIVGRAVDVIWNVTPTEVNFPYTRVGDFRDQIVTVQNTSPEQDLQLDVQLFAGHAAFSIFSGAGVHMVAPGASLDVVVRFRPSVTGYFLRQLSLADFIMPVQLTGAAGPHEESCVVSPTAIDFGDAPVAWPAARSFTVLNAFTEPLTLAPASDSPFFAVSGGPLVLPSGESAEFTVTFAPEDVGPQSAIITTGHPDCPAVTCIGTGVSSPAPGGLDQIGIYFDEFYTVNEVQAESASVVPGYLVLTYPSDMSGVTGWECAVNLVGPAFFLWWALEGQTVNIGTMPEFIVGVAEPLPAADAVLLASFQLFVTTETSAVQLLMGPIANPTLPSQMAWVAGDGQTILPMVTNTGEDVVAAINKGAPTGLAAPTPELTLNGGTVRLIWPAPVEPGRDCHVYRRTAEALPERLTTQPMPATGATLEYVDHLTGFARGTRLFYSYAVLVDGIESARSPEVETVVPEVPIPATRLLPNVPNPFNPQTEIRFELGEPGNVRVVIYDVTGHQVKVLANEYLGAGPYSRIWQGRDESGRRVSSGAYYVRLEVGGGVDHQKIMLLK